MACASGSQLEPLTVKFLICVDSQRREYSYAHSSSRGYPTNLQHDKGFLQTRPIGTVRYDYDKPEPAFRAWQVC